MNNEAKSDYLELLKKSLRIKTVNPPGNETELAKMYAEYLSGKGLDAWIEPIREGRGNFAAKIDGRSSESQIVFCGHLDTVPAGSKKWSHDPFSAEEAGGKIYGRGASDMKSGLTAMVAAFAELGVLRNSPPCDLILVGTAGEEVDCLGARAYLEKHDMKSTRLLVIGEPTDCTVVTRQKGAAWISVSASGKTAHGSMPELGENAIYRINAFISELLLRKAAWEKHNSETTLGEATLGKATLGEATLSVNRISGGSAPNMVADACSVLIDFRLLPGQDLSDATGFIENILKDTKGQYPNIATSYSVVNYMKPVASPDDSQYIKAAVGINRELFNAPLRASGLNFYTDASVLTEKSDFPVIFYGPGDDTMAHQIDECVDSEKFLRSVEFYKKLVLYEAADSPD